MLVTVCSCNLRYTKYYACSMVQQPLVDQGFLIIEVSRSHSETLRSVGILWTSDQPDAETSTWQHVTLTRDRHAHPRRDSNLLASKLAATDPRKRKRGHWDRLLNKIYFYADKWPFSYIQRVVVSLEAFYNMRNIVVWIFWNINCTVIELHMLFLLLLTHALVASSKLQCNNKS